MKNIFRILLLIGGVFLGLSQQEEVPEFYKEMMSKSPNINKVDELYNQYRRETPITFSQEELKQIEEMRASAKEDRSSWVSNARKENAPIKKEFRDEYEKQYIDWRKLVQPYIQADGSIVYPDDDEFAKSFRRTPTGKIKKGELKSMAISSGAKKLYSSTTIPYHSTFNGWKYFGPVQLLTNDGNPTVTSQANVRAFAQSKSNPNVVVCAVENGTIYISHNKGGMWHLATRGYNIRNITALAISPNDENVIYAAGGHKHYVSRDGGVTWEYITLNAGYTWLPSYNDGRGDNPGGPASKILVSNVDGNPLNDIVLFSTSKGILKLTQTRGNRGKINYRFEKKLSMNMTDIIKRTNRDEYFALGYDSQKKHMYFYSSTDRGETWTRKGRGWYEPSGAMEKSWGGRLAMSVNDENVVYAHLIENRVSGDNGFLGVFRSDDGGENWFLPDTNGPGKGTVGYSNTHPNIVTFPWGNTTGSYHQGFYNCAIIVNPNNSKHFVVGGLNAYSSRDGGVTFERFGGYSGPKQLHPDMQTFYQQKNADGSVDTWLTTDGGINYSNDFFEITNIVRTAGLGSDYWGFDMGEYNTNMGGGMYHNGNTYHVESYGSGTFKALGGGESSTGYVFPGENERHMYFSDFGGIIASKELNERQKPAPALDPVPKEPYAGQDTYYTLRDFRGNTYYYKQTKEDLASGIIQLYRFTRTENKSTLLKQLQFPANTGIQQYVVSFSHPMYQYLIAGNELYSSKDGGENWVKMTKPFDNNTTLAVSDNDPNIIYALRRYQTGNDMLKKSTDGGRTFTSINNPNQNVNYRHIVKVRGTDVVFLFGNNESKVFYFIDGAWKEYSEDLPVNLTVLEPKIQYRSGEFYMATSGAGIWTRKLPDDVLAKMRAIKMNIDSPTKFSFNKEYNFKVTDASLYYGKTITRRVWEFPGAKEVLNANTDNPTVIYDKYGRFGVKLTLTDNNGRTYTQTFPDYFTVYPYCACDVPDILKKLLPSMEVWVDASKANLVNNSLTDRFNAVQYNIKSPENGVAIKELNGHKVLSFKDIDQAYIDLNKDYEGSTLFVVSKLAPQTSSSFSFLLGAGGAADFHSGGRFGPIFNRNWISSRDRFSGSGAKTMINNIQKDYFGTNFVTDNLALYTLRIGEGQTPAKVRYISKDRGQANRNWRGEIAEVIIFNKRLTDDEVTQVNQYLMSKYNLR